MSEESKPCLVWPAEMLPPPLRSLPQRGREGVSAQVTLAQAWLWLPPFLAGRGRSVLTGRPVLGSTVAMVLRAPTAHLLPFAALLKDGD